MKKAIQSITPKQWLIYLPLLTGVGTSGYFGVPALMDLMQHQIDRVDVVIYLMCEEDQDCVDEAWIHIISQKRLREAISGDHH